MSSLQDTPQQALAGWLHQRGGEKAIKKMAEDLVTHEGDVHSWMDTDSSGRVGCTDLAIAIALYTDGEVIFPICPVWAVVKARRPLNG